MIFKALFCRFFVKLERDNYIRALVAGKLTRHNNGTSAIWAFGSAGCFVTDDLTAAGITEVNLLTVKLPLHPFVSGLT